MPSKAREEFIQNRNEGIVFVREVDTDSDSDDSSSSIANVVQLRNTPELTNNTKKRSSSVMVLSRTPEVSRLHLTPSNNVKIRMSSDDQSSVRRSSLDLNYQQSENMKRASSFFSKSSGSYSPLDDNDRNKKNRLTRLMSLRNLETQSKRKTSDSDLLRRGAIGRRYSLRINQNVPPASPMSQRPPSNIKFDLNHGSPNLARRRSISFTASAATMGDKSSSSKKLSRQGTFSFLKKHLVAPVEHSDTDDTLDDVDDDSDSETSMFPLKNVQVQDPTMYSKEIAEYSHNVRNINNMHVILLHYIMSFLDIKDLARLGATSTKMYLASMNDILWTNELLRNGCYKIVYDSEWTTHLTGTESTSRERFYEFLKEKERRAEQKKHHLRLFQRAHHAQLIYQCGYGFLSPLVFTIGFSLSIFLLALYLEKMISQTRLNLFLISSPFLLLSCPGIVFTLVGLFVDPLVLNPFKQNQYISALENGFSNLTKTGHQFDFIQFSEDRSLISIINIILWSASSIPLMVLCALFKLILLPNRGPYSIIPIPIYLMDIAIGVGPILSHFICSTESLKEILRGETEELSKKHVVTILLIYLLSCSFNILLSCQAAMICGKLDQIILEETKWLFIFIPSYLMLTLASFTCAMSTLLSIWLSDGMTNCSNISFICSGFLLPCTCIPTLLSLVLLGVKLDGLGPGITYTHILLPMLFVSIILIVLGAVSVSGGCFFFKYLRYRNAQEGN